MDYDKIYAECVDTWQLIDTMNTEINGLYCKIEQFSNKITNRNIYFFFVNDIIIGVGDEYIQCINIFNEEY